MLSLLICLPLQLSLPPAADLSAPPAEPSALHYFMPICLHFTADLSAAATNVAAILADLSAPPAEPSASLIFC